MITHSKCNLDFENHVDTNLVLDRYFLSLNFRDELLWASVLRTKAGNLQLQTLHQSKWTDNFLYHDTYISRKR